MKRDREFTEARAVGECEWKKDANNGGVYFTSCNNAHEFSAGELDDNSYIYCPYCGKKIKEAK